MRTNYFREGALECPVTLVMDMKEVQLKLPPFRGSPGLILGHSKFGQLFSWFIKSPYIYTYGGALDHHQLYQIKDADAS